MSGQNPVKMMLPLGLMYGMKYIDVEDEMNIMYMRIFFVAGQILMLCLWLYIRTTIQNSKDERIMKVSDEDLKPANPLAGMLGQPEEPKGPKKDLKFTKYDMDQVAEKLKGVLIQSAIVGGIHYKWGTALPLIMSTMMGLLDLPENPLVRIYLLKADDEKEKDLKRPWKAKSPFSGMQEAMEKAKKEQEKQKAIAEGREWVDEDGNTVNEDDEEEEKKSKKKAIEADEDEDDEDGKTTKAIEADGFEDVTEQEEAKDAAEKAVEQLEAKEAAAKLKSVTLSGAKPLGIRIATENTSVSAAPYRHMVGSIEAGGQAGGAGLRTGQSVEAINGESVVKMTHDDLLALIGKLKEAGTDLELSLRPNKIWTDAIEYVETQLELGDGDEKDAGYWAKVFVATGELYSKCKLQLQPSLRDTKKSQRKLRAITKQSFKEFDAEDEAAEAAGAAEQAGEEGKKKEPSFRDSWMYKILLGYCLVSFVLPIKPTDLLKQLFGVNATVPAGGGGADAGQGQSFGADEFDEI